MSTNSQIETLSATTAGRYRLRVFAILDRSDRAEALLFELRRLDGMASASANPRTGTLLLQTRGALGLDELIASIRQHLDLPEEELSASRPGTRPAAARPVSKPAGEALQHADTTPWHAMRTDEVLAHFKVAAAQGLSLAEAEARLLHYGPNRLPERKGRSSFEMLREQVASLPVGILVVSAVVSAATGGLIDAAATLVVVAANTAIGYVTEARAERTIASLMQEGPQETLTRRDGEDRPLPSAELVPGDIYVLHPGLYVPTDARLLEARNLSIDESALTGESVPVGKQPHAQFEPDTPLGGRTNMLHAGTLVTSGRGVVVATATGSASVLAQVQRLSMDTARPPTPIEQDLDQLGRKLAFGSIAACGLFMGIGLLRGYPALPMLKDALALAVAAVPEGLPTVATTTLALGLKRLSHRGVLVRELNAVESLGAIETLCLDKTGTLTENRMRIVACATAGCVDAPMELEGKTSDPPSGPDLQALLKVAVLCNDAEIAVVDGRQEVDGSSATERALQDFAIAQGLDGAGLRADLPRLHTFERHETRRYMATFHREPGQGELLIAVKGSPDELLQLCDRRQIDGQIHPLTEQDKEAILALNDHLAARPARVLGFAQGCGAPREDGHLPGLVWLGLAGLRDPLRASAKPLIKALHRAGIRTVMITGDQGATAYGLARELDLAQGAPIELLDSADIGRLPQEALQGLARRAQVFARVTPDQKLAIVQALQADGTVVAMTGDGINDGPALKAANVAIAMGEEGTNLARDVANVVIERDDLESLIGAIGQGRDIYENMHRSLKFIISTNVSEILVGMVEALHGPEELETPMELLWLNLVTDVLPGLGLSLAPPSRSTMDGPGHSSREGVIGRKDLREMGTDASIIALASLTAHFYGLRRHGPGPTTRAMTFVSLALGQLLYALTCQKPVRDKPFLTALFANRNLDLTLAGALVLQVLPFAFGRLGRVLGLGPMPRRDLVVSLLAAAAPFVITEVRHSLADRSRRKEEQAP